MYGFGLHGMGFYHLQFNEKDAKNGKEYSGVLTIKGGVANTTLVREELKVYDDK
jgi:hypothetical protein